MQTELKKNRKVYIVVTQTGTVLSRILRIITGAKYNHSSITVDGTLNTMYSFGRLNPYNPFFGGFVQESIHNGTFKRFKNTEAAVYEINITEEEWYNLKTNIAAMYENRKKYSYNYIGLILAAFRIKYKKQNHYYCSEFVKDILVQTNVVDENSFYKIVKPIDFTKLNNVEQIYEGKLASFEH